MCEHYETDLITRTPARGFFDRDVLRLQFEVDARVDGVAFGRNASGLENQRLEFFAAGVLSRRGSGFARNVFFHQRSAVVVGAGVQAELRQAPVQLYPGHLNIVDRARQHDSRQGVNLEMLGQSGAGARESLLKQQACSDARSPAERTR